MSSRSLEWRLGRRGVGRTPWQAQQQRRCHGPWRLQMTCLQLRLMQPPAWRRRQNPNPHISAALAALRWQLSPAQRGAAGMRVSPCGQRGQTPSQTWPWARRGLPWLAPLTPWKPLLPLTPPLLLLPLAVSSCCQHQMAAQASHSHRRPRHCSSGWRSTSSCSCPRNDRQRHANRHRAAARQLRWPPAAWSSRPR
jgi:hypothetical protein